MSETDILELASELKAEGEAFALATVVRTVSVTAATELEAKVTLKIGPVKARFSGNVVLDPSQAPGNFSLQGEGNGGVAGFAKGGADVELTEDGDETILKYQAKAAIGGKLAQLGSRLVAGTSRKLAAKFFVSFAKELSAEQVV